MNDEKTPGRVWTIKELIDWTAADFVKRGIDTARLDAELLLAHALDCKRVELYLRFDQTPDPPALDRFRELVKRRRGRESVTHILGRRPFHDIELEVPPMLFAPRPETELLVDEALARLRLVRPDRAAVADVCAGTGAIGLAIVHALPGLRAFFTDLEPRAGAAVAGNAARLGLADRIAFLEGDLFAPLAGLGPFTLIASNPPYVPTAEIDGLMPEVRDHEPRLALDGGPDGLDLTRRLIAGAPALLAAGGWLLLELGEGQAQAVAGLASAALALETFRADLAGIQRIAIFRKPTSDGSHAKTQRRKEERRTFD